MLPEEAHAAQVFKAGGAGYINKESAGEELTAAIRKVANGGKYVSANFAENWRPIWLLALKNPCTSLFPTASTG